MEAAPERWCFPPSKLAPPPWAAGAEGTGLACLAEFCGSHASRSESLAVATPCGLTCNSTLAVEGPSVAAGPSAFYSLLLSLFCSAFSPFFPRRLGFAAGEADSFASGEALDQAGQKLSPVAGYPWFGGWPSPARARFLPV